MTSAISLTGVGKRYQLTDDVLLLGRLRRLGARRRSGRELWALRDLDLEVAPGETLGIIGRNGSGKTTLLRLLSGVSAPSTGHLRVVGRIAPLIGVGVGFHPELTGRENVFVNGRLLGLTAGQVRSRFDAIVDFSEIESFIDTPVKFYSSGMFLRLAFAVAIHTDPEVLLVDEVLAVGDLAFQLKCSERMREVQARGTTIVIVTHNLNNLDQLSSRAVLLSHGRKVFDGPTEQAIGAMHKVMEDDAVARGSTAADMLQKGQAPDYVGGAKVRVELLDAMGRPTSSVTSGATVTVRLHAEFQRAVDNPLLGIMVAVKGVPVPVYAVHNSPGSYEGCHGPDAPFTAEIVLQTDRLLTGTYTVLGGLYDDAGGAQLGQSLPEPLFVSSSAPASGVADLAAQVSVGGHPVELRIRSRLG